MPRLILALVLLVFAGCGGAAEDSKAARATSAGSAGEALTAVDVERFLKVVHDHEEAMIPEFTPPDEEESLDPMASASALVESYQTQCRRLFDVERQGSIWRRDTQWSRAMARSKIAPDRFAALVRDVSLAIMRVRLESRIDVARLVTEARRQVDRAVRTMDEIDQVPLHERTQEAVTLRTRNVIQLGRAVALLEFAELIRNVPPESAAVVRRYSSQLKPLLPASIKDELLAELKNLAVNRDSEVEPASFEVEEEASRDSAAPGR